MPNDGTGAGWVTTAPANADNLSAGAQEIRDLRLGVGIRSDKEHVALATSSAGGEHKPGSAKVYFQTSAPTLRPDGTTSLTSGDYGRLYWDSDATSPTLQIYTASGWGSIIATGALVTAMLADASVTTVKIADSNVTTAKIADSNVTTAKIADANVTTVKILDANVTTAKIADVNVTTGKLADSAVTTAKINDGAVTGAKLASGARVYVGSYTGSGVNPKVITGIGFTPAIVFIYTPSGANGDTFWAQAGDGDLHRSADADISGGITMASDGFSITTTSSTVNANGSVYRFVAYG